MVSLFFQRASTCRALFVSFDQEKQVCLALRGCALFCFLPSFKQNDLCLLICLSVLTKTPSPPHPTPSFRLFPEMPLVVVPSPSNFCMCLYLCSSVNDVSFCPPPLPFTTFHDCSYPYSHPGVSKPSHESGLSLPSGSVPRSLFFSLTLSVSSLCYLTKSQV